MKTTEKEFERFKKAFLYWKARFHCVYRINFFHQPIEGAYAYIHVDEEGATATVEFSKELSTVDFENRPSPENLGLHEAIHLVLHRLFWYGCSRFIKGNELDLEWEHLVRVFEDILMEGKS